MMMRFFSGNIGKQKTPPVRMNRSDYGSRDEAKAAYAQFEKWARERNKLLDAGELNDSDARAFIKFFNDEYDAWQSMAKAWPK